MGASFQVSCISLIADAVCMSTATIDCIPVVQVNASNQLVFAVMIAIAAFVLAAHMGAND